MLLIKLVNYLRSNFYFKINFNLTQSITLVNVLNDLTPNKLILLEIFPEKVKIRPSFPECLVKSIKSEYLVK